MYALVAAHIAHLLLNWYNDSFVMRQRINCGGCRTSQEPHKPPAALPASGLVRWFRLIGAVVILFDLIQTSSDANCKVDAKCKVDHVSHATHLFGALSGFLAGFIFLKVREPGRKTLPVRHYFKQFLVFVYGFIVSCVIVKFVMCRYQIITDPFREDTEYCPWFKYEAICQDQCYRGIHHLNQTLNCTVSLCQFQ